MTTVQCYRNLNKRCLSLKAKVDGKWKVVDYTHQVVMRNVKFKINHKARQRILDGEHRSVHAIVEGELVSTDADYFFSSDAKIPYYSPYTTECFEIDGLAVTEADLIRLQVR